MCVSVGIQSSVRGAPLDVRHGGLARAAGLLDPAPGDNRVVLIVPHPRAIVILREVVVLEEDDVELCKVFVVCRIVDAALPRRGAAVAAAGESPALHAIPAPGRHLADLAEGGLCAFRSQRNRLLPAARAYRAEGPLVCLLTRPHRRVVACHHDGRLDRADLLHNRETPSPTYAQRIVRWIVNE